jgi:XTP/dITP diphosphohydrolase
VPVILEARDSSLPDIDETGMTLEENARLKATDVCARTGLPAIADDTGLEVDALGGAPGVRSARFAGADASYSDNVDLLLARLANVPEPDRTARFATVAIARWPDGREVAALGTVEGVIAATPRGRGGFGYDPVFVPIEGDGRTFAEMRPEEKHAISHRGRAFRTLAEGLRTLVTTTEA